MAMVSQFFAAHLPISSSRLDILISEIVFVPNLLPVLVGMLFFETTCFYLITKGLFKIEVSFVKSLAITLAVGTISYGLSAGEFFFSRATLGLAPWLAFLIYFFGAAIIKWLIYVIFFMKQTIKKIKLLFVSFSMGIVTSFFPYIIFYFFK